VFCSRPWPPLATFTRWCPWLVRCMPDEQADMYMSRAEVSRLAGRVEEARAAVEEAIGRYDAKGYMVAAVRAHQLLTELECS